ncbi:phosphate ABC transporter permease PstA [Stigmatella aurantiaca]|uniref:Phosphate transport system permease protein PstA n=1 Tax=Stigmatella aurantiaca (strain DW4/3-1) TaxID=378806 RepID=Q08WL6_STIAD|nr:phosphate ABC transporter permease PstA [Stigmatella aurantiaca]ADO73396.1 Phosphate ABC transporter, permease protein PstA [Stigmatella aurantiaca DW4/3-1]EAU64883.1 phosphate ABC transporter, permease protein PstA [Stigmatella aurantiaca DW4/3-1]
MKHATRRTVGAALTSLTGLAALLIVTMLALILLDVLRGGAGHVTWEFLSQPPSDGMMRGGIFPALYGTAALTLLMTLAVMPVGVLTAVYLHEYASPDSRLARWVRVAIVNLAGVPSIVFGLFGLGFFIHFVGGGMDRMMGYQTMHWAQPSILWASLTLAVLTLPVVIVSTEEALRAVPMDHRTASLALGATQSQTLMRVVLPGALPGILTGAVLAVSRGAGEVAPILFTGAAYFLPDLPTSLSSQFMHLGYHTYVLATQSPDIEATRPLLYATVLVLLMLTFALNLVAVVIRTRTRRRAANAH